MGAVHEQDLENTYRRYFPMIREKCRRVLHDPGEAEDVAQEAFIKLWQARLTTTDEKQTSAWIYKTSTRLAIDRLRQRSQRERLATQAADHRSPSAASSPSSEAMMQTRQELAGLASSIAPDELAVAILRRVDGLSHEEVAEVLGVSARTVRRIVHKLDERLARLRKEMSA
jgi:RNA polymerase sigma-70 factor, ECF subfamily